MARSEAKRGSAAKSGAIKDYWREVVRIRFPKRKVVSALSGIGPASLATAVIAAVGDHGAEGESFDLVVESRGGDVGRVSFDALSDSEDRAFEAAVMKSLAAVGVEPPVIDLADGVKLRLHLRYDGGNSGVRQRVAEGEGGELGRVADRIVRSFQEHVGKQLTELPRDFKSRRAGLRALDGVVRESYAKAFEPALNAEAERRPHATYEEKKALAKWVNAELRELGLTLRCPKTGQPAILRGAPASSSAGRFHLEITDEKGSRHRTVTSVAIPRLELRPDDLARAPYGERADRSR